VLPARAQLGLARRLAGVEGGGLSGGLARVGVDLGAAQPQRVVRNLRDVAGKERDAITRAAPTQAQVAQPALCFGVRPKTDRLELRQLRLHIQSVVQRGLHAQAQLAQAEVADIDIEPRAALFRRHAEQRDHAARAVAVEH